MKGVASAMVSTMRLLGHTLSMGLALMVFAIFIGNVAITQEQYPALLSSIHIVFIVCTVICFVGIFAALIKQNGVKKIKKINLSSGMDQGDSLILFYLEYVVCGIF